MTPRPSAGALSLVRAAILAANNPLTMLVEAAKALPDNIPEIIGALITLFTAIWGAFKRGKEVGRVQGRQER